jgi:hypothetical protein
MLLFISENCSFCEIVKAVEGLVTVKVVSTPDGLRMSVDGNLLQLPQELEGLPELVIGSDFYVGLIPVENKLKELGLISDH